MTDLIDLIERAKWADAASRRARARCNDAPAHIGADLYVMRTYPCLLQATHRQWSTCQRGRFVLGLVTSRASGCGLLSAIMASRAP